MEDQYPPEPATAAGGARQLLDTPLITAEDVLSRVAALAVPMLARRKERTLWLFFLYADRTQADVVIPIGDFPEHPEPGLASDACYIASRVLADTVPSGTTVIALSRPGQAAPSDSDLALLRALRDGARAHAVPVTMICLATSHGARELGPGQAPGKPGPTAETPPPPAHEPGR